MPLRSLHHFKRTGVCSAQSSSVPVCIFIELIYYGSVAANDLKSHSTLFSESSQKLPVVVMMGETLTQSCGGFWFGLFVVGGFNLFVLTFFVWFSSPPTPNA